MISDKLRQKIMNKVISLEKFGINDLAWHKRDVTNLINSLMGDDIGILGGDVYRLTGKQLQPTYDNWACEPNNQESLKDYYSRSKRESLSYIENYPIEDEENIVFSITFTE